jgi:hypothetical protein
MKKKKKKFLKYSLFLFSVFLIIILFLFFKKDDLFSIGIDNSLFKSSTINIQEIKKNIDNMNPEEIEKTINKIEEEIERLKSSI